MELTVKWDDYRPLMERRDAIQKRMNEITAIRGWSSDGATYNEWHTLLDEINPIEDKMDEMRPRLIPEAGMPCTVRWYSDSSGAHVEKVISPKKIQVKCDGLYSCTKIFTFRRNGHWVEAGSTSRDWSTLLSLGYRHDYYDLSF